MVIGCFGEAPLEGMGSDALLVSSTLKKVLLGENSVERAVMGVASSELPVHDQTDYGIRLMEEERRRVARDLHDGPAQALTNISMRLDAVQQLYRTNPEMALAEVARINSRVIAAVNDVRRLIHDLRPLAIDEVGLILAVKQLCQRCERDWNVPIEVTVNSEVTEDISPAKQVVLYRLVQEILNNTRKHAAATRVSVEFSRSGAELILTLRDNGKGFDPSDIPAGHYGLIGMRERVQYMGGDFQIDSQRGRGSEFRIAVKAYAEDGHV